MKKLGNKSEHGFDSSRTTKYGKTTKASDAAVLSGQKWRDAELNKETGEYEGEAENVRAGPQWAQQQAVSVEEQTAEAARRAGLTVQIERLSVPMPGHTLISHRRASFGGPTCAVDSRMYLDGRTLHQLADLASRSPVYGVRLTSVDVTVDVMRDPKIEGGRYLRWSMQCDRPFSEPLSTVFGGFVQKGYRRVLPKSQPWQWSQPPEEVPDLVSRLPLELGVGFHDGAIVRRRLTVLYLPALVKMLKLAKQSPCGHVMLARCGISNQVVTDEKGLSPFQLFGFKSAAPVPAPFLPWDLPDEEDADDDDDE